MNDKNRSERDIELIDFFRGAIRIPSPSGGEKDVAHYLSLKMQKLGFDEVHIDDFGSVVGIINGNYDGKTVLIGDGVKQSKEAAVGAVISKSNRFFCIPLKINI